MEFSLSASFSVLSYSMQLATLQAHFESYLQDLVVTQS